MIQPPESKPMRLATERFLLRTHVPDDASDHWLSWLVDRDVMGPLNAPISEFTLESLKEYIVGFDSSNRFLIGIYERASELHIGFHVVYVNRPHRVANFNVFIGDKDWWGQRVVLETRAMLLDYFFSEQDIEKAIGLPLERNFPAIFNYKAQGWALEGILKGHVLSAIDGTRIDQYQFGMLRDDWQELRQAS